MQIELSGIVASGRAAEVGPGTLIAVVVKVKTPDDETLYSVTGRPLKLNVNGKTVYKSLDTHPKPKLPGYTYFIIRPSYNTHNLSLIKNIKSFNAPNIHIKSFKYIPLS